MIDLGVVSITCYTVMLTALVIIKIYMRILKGTIYAVYFCLFTGLATGPHSSTLLLFTL